ncbi:MAG: ATP-binding protein [Candidatus Latescibacterota bacterium]|nr:MAG: ATP-binding protein [Candidatus Latescibacterota bacterium]
MVKDTKDIKKEVAEIKFLIHDLRVESFINEVIHFHVTVNTDLEVHNIEQARALHDEDLQELKAKAVSQRKILQEYSNAVKSFSPDRTILAVGEKYVETIYDICELILNPRWGRSDQLLSFLPKDSRSVRSCPQYLNCIRWICGVYYRIQHFMEEKGSKDLAEEFDIAEELQDFVRSVIYGYVIQKSSARVDIQIENMDSAILQGNRYRFRRMFFNLVMNAVDAMNHRKVGVLNIGVDREGDKVVLRVRDTGSGMGPEKIQQLMIDKKNLDGELHSLGFVFVRQTVADFGGELSIESEVDKGTTISISLPFQKEGEAAAKHAPECEKLELLRGIKEVRSQKRTEHAKKVGTVEDDKLTKCGEVVYSDYEISDSQFPGSIFAIGVTEEDKIDFFTHRPYQRYWNITHEDLSPMFYEATFRGRVEEEEDKTPTLILKAPQNTREYFEFRSISEKDRSKDKFINMVRDEYIRIARKLIDTGMTPDIGVHLTDLQKFFPKREEQLEQEPFPLEILAKQKLTSEINE